MKSLEMSIEKVKLHIEWVNPGMSHINLITENNG